MADSAATRKQRGAWFTPEVLIAEMVDWLCRMVPDDGGPLRVVDPACGDGRLLRAVRDAFPHRDLTLIGCDIDPDTAALAAGDGVETFVADALDHDWEAGTFDIVIGNPPFLSQLANETTRGGSSRYGGGPYANAAAEFAVLSTLLAREDGGLVTLVLPQSVLGARDTAAIRETIDRTAQLKWSWWQPTQAHFDAAVNVCILGWKRPGNGEGTSHLPWTTVITERLGVPAVPDALDSAGTVADRCNVGADFRNQFYGLVPGVGDHAIGPPLITSGLIEPGRCDWGDRPVRFAKQRFMAPRVDVTKLEPPMQAWAERKLVPKVLVANQTRIIEAVCDPNGEWIPSVPVISVVPSDGRVAPWDIAAVLSSPIASAFVWHLAGGTGLSAVSLRIAPRHLAAVPWPAGDLTEAAEAISSGALVEAGRSVLGAYGLASTGETELDELMRWWTDRLDRSTAR